MTRPRITKRDIERSMRLFDEIAKSDYAISFAKLIADANRRRKSTRIRHIAGVAMKKDFSVRTKTRRRGVHLPSGYDIKWKIDPTRLAKMPADHWSLDVLRYSPDRKAGESTKKLALRLRRETLLWRSFKKTIHNYICNDLETRQTVKKALAGAGLGVFTKTATPEGLIQAIGFSLAGAIAAKFPVAAPGVAVAAVVMGTLGIDAICSGGARKRPNKTVQRTGASRLAQKPNRTSSAAGSRR